MFGEFAQFAFGFLLAIVTHESGHAIAAKAYNVEIDWQTVVVSDCMSACTEGKMRKVANGAFVLSALANRVVIAQGWERNPVGAGFLSFNILEPYSYEVRYQMGNKADFYHMKSLDRAIWMTEATVTAYQANKTWQILPTGNGGVMLTYNRGF